MPGAFPKNCVNPRCNSPMTLWARYCSRCGTSISAKVVDPRRLSPHQQVILGFQLAGGSRDVVAEPPIEQCPPWSSSPAVV